MVLTDNELGMIEQLTYLIPMRTAISVRSGNRSIQLLKLKREKLQSSMSKKPAPLWWQKPELSANFWRNICQSMA